MNECSNCKYSSNSYCKKCSGYMVDDIIDEV